MVLCGLVAFCASDFTISEAEAFGHHRKRKANICCCQPVIVDPCGCGGTSTAISGAGYGSYSSPMYGDSGVQGYSDAQPSYAGQNGTYNSLVNGSNPSNRVSNPYGATTRNDVNTNAGEQNRVNNETTSEAISGEAAAGGQDVNARPRAQGAPSVPAR